MFNNFFNKKNNNGDNMPQPGGGRLAAALKVNATAKAAPVSTGFTRTPV